MIRAVLALVPLVAAACAGPVVRSQASEPLSRALAVVAVAPFVAGPGFEASPDPEAPAAVDAAKLVARFVSESFEAEGLEVVPPSDLRQAFASEGREIPVGRPAELAALAAERFGATSLLMGTVQRFRERRGGRGGALAPSSVGYELVLHDAPSARPLWTVRFDETQRALTDDFFRAIRYPGRGTRWLSAAELARWGASHAARAAQELR